MTPVEDTAGEFFCSFENPCPGTAGFNIKNYKYDCKIKNILRCYAVGMGMKETANTFHISRNTVRKYVRLFISSGKPTERLLELTEEQLREMFGCTEFRHREPSQRQLELDALIPGYVARLSRKGMTVRKLFNEYRDGHPDGFSGICIQTCRQAIPGYTPLSSVMSSTMRRQMYIDSRRRLTSR